MQSFIATICFLLIVAAPASTQTQGISTALLDTFIHYASICMATYDGDLCLSPGGLTKVTDITNSETDVHGWILRDDAAQEIVVAFRGTESVQNYESDMNYTLADFDTMPSCTNCQVHGGYYLLWESVVDDVQSLLESQTSQYPDYGVVITGHSLGGSLAALAAAQFSSTYENMTVYTMGEPRTGNAAFASYIDTHFQTNSSETTRFFRCTHANDGVPNLPPLDLGYVHHGLEYWNTDPTGTNTSYICGAETTECCGGQNGTGINAAHLVYWGKPLVIGGQCL
ncbi:S133a Anfaea-ferulic acid complex [Mollisia scopiformis]|uniref:S133a Anfaea-ferulic acid complex n=1 Tax=Mollisia scopiformis TaxID=149040 RepID=A0A194XI57_MOLSC|nr:S133a Anfaea-ferulic acid complex [Mollisia scopiformis]KUJ19447.1 S133a Anfaea-ferulic acid complex [Mollisia scopiformis]